MRKVTEFIPNYEKWGYVGYVIYLGSCYDLYPPHNQPTMAYNAKRRRTMAYIFIGTTFAVLVGALTFVSLKKKKPYNIDIVLENDNGPMMIDISTVVEQGYYMRDENEVVFLARILDADATDFDTSGYRAYMTDELALPLRMNNDELMQTVREYDLNVRYRFVDSSYNTIMSITITPEMYR